MTEPDYRVLFESAPGLYLALLPDAPRYTIVAVSDAYARATMTRREDIVGRGLFDVFPDNPEDPEASGVRNLGASLGRVVASGASDAMAVQKYDVRRPQDQGGGFEVRWWSPVNSPAFGRDGRLAYLLHRVEDVTEFIRLKQQGQEQEQAAVELRTRTASMEAEVYARAQQLQQANEELRAAHEEVLRLCDRMREVDRLKTEFFANVSHELRTPLTLILGPTQRLLAAVDCTDFALQQDLAVIARNARTLLRHVDDLLDVAKLEEEELRPAYEDIDVAALARLVAGHFSSVALDLGTGLTMDVPAALPAHTDARMLQRVLFNLLSNAFKFTPAGTQVRLSLARHGDRLAFEVADSGPGIPPEWRDAVFERFRQLHGQADRRHAGTGLGLAIAKEFVQLLGGKISIDQAPEGGALFVVELPLRAPHGAALAPEAAGLHAVLPLAAEALNAARPEPVVPAAGDGPVVLVVEDNPDMSRFICQGLETRWRVATAFNGEQGLQQALALRPDLVLTDIMMPDTSGEWLLQALCSHPELHDTPVLVLSARADDELRVRLLRQGAQDYLVKPFSVEELCARVGTQLARTQALASLRRSEEYWRELFIQASDGILIGNAACDRIVDANDAACALLGRSRKEVVGASPGEWLQANDVRAFGEAAVELRAGRAVTLAWAVQGDGSEPTHLAVTARKLSDGRCLALLRDDTQRRLRESATLELAGELEHRVAERTEQLRRVAADLEATESRERRQIARDLHDDLGQVLAAARIRLATLCRDTREDVRQAALGVAELVERANRSTRSLAAQIAPAVLYELGLASALEWLAEEVSGSFGLKVQVFDDGQPKPLSQEARSICYRAVRELLINVAKHAGVASAEVHLQREAGELVIRVSDGGVGFVAQEQAVARRGLGLVSVAERLSFVGGTFSVRSIPGDGTEAALQLPLDPDQVGREIPVNR